MGGLGEVRIKKRRKSQKQDSSGRTRGGGTGARREDGRAQGCGQVRCLLRRAPARTEGRGRRLQVQEKEEGAFWDHRQVIFLEITLKIIAEQDGSPLGQAGGSWGPRAVGHLPELGSSQAHTTLETELPLHTGSPV